MSGTVLVETGQCRPQDVQESGQVGDVESSPSPQDHIEPGSVDEVHDDSRPLLGQGDHLPHSHQTGVSQHAQIGQPPQDPCSATPVRQVDDPDDDIVALDVQATPRRAGSRGAPHHLTDGVALTRQSAECRVGNARLGIGHQEAGGMRPARTTASKHRATRRPRSTSTTCISDFTIGRLVIGTGAHRWAHAFHGHYAGGR